MTIKKHNYLVLIEAKNCNPNGDPDNENQPRIDPDSEYGIITNQCLNRKIRNQILMRHPGEEGFDIYIQNDTFLNGKSQQAYTELGYTKKDSSDKSVIQQAKEFMLKKYFDVRTFGAVMSTGDFPAGRVTGTVQTSFATSLHPITVQEITLTRQAVTSEERFKANVENEMGKKFIVPYGLYAFNASVSAVQAEKNGFTEADLKAYEEALINMFENDESSARTNMSVKAVYRFTHEHELGNAPAWKLYDLIKAEPKKDYPRSFSDFDITVDEAHVPQGVTLEKIF